MAFWRPFETHEIELSEENIELVAPTPLIETCSEFNNKDLHVQSQRLILNIYECLKRENIEKSDNDIVNKIHELTKLSTSTIYRVIKERDENLENLFVCF